MEIKTKDGNNSSKGNIANFNELLDEEQLMSSVLQS